MAETVSSVLKKLASFLLEKVQEVQAVRGQIEQVQKELRLIQALLTDVDSKFNRNNVVTEWLNQVREIADRIATVIDTFRVKIEEKKRADSSNWLVRQFKTAKRNYKTYMLGLHDELENIIEELNRLYQRRTDLRIEDLGDLDDVDDPVACDDVDDPEVVGLEDDKEKIIEQLRDRSISRRTVLSIVGTGGLGKTTLAQKVYNSDKLEGQFDCRAWLSISQTYNLNELLREILYKVKPDMKNKDPPVTDRDLPVKLKNYFLKGKRYLIILDDVWETNFWGQLKRALPDMYNASCVIITTRLLDVAKAADCNTKPYKLRYLSDDEGLALLFRNTFQEHVQPENYPVHLLDVAKRLTKKCGGLPLALVVLGGILTMRDRNYTAWNTLYETIDWHDKDGIQCSQVLAKSYEDLPQYLKDCFLYLAAFPEDYQISGVHLTRMWMAEGFVPKDGGGTIEDRAEKCLEELVQRCLIQVTKKSWNGYCKYCSMHDLLRDLAIRKAKDDNFFTVFSKEEDVNNLAASMPCRAALQFCTPTEDDIYSENTRSLLCFGFGIFSSNNSGFGLLNYSGFRSLRVLTLENVDMTTFTRRQWSEGLIHLKYLRLRNCNIPHDIFKQFSFPNLETIDLNRSRVDNEEKTLDLCDVVIPTLRHVYGNGVWYGFHLPLKWNKHTNLQTIKDVTIHIESVVEFGFCINLRTLGIFIVDDDDDNNERAIKEWQNLKSVLKNTVQLVHLCIGTYGFLPFGGTKDLPCHEKIQNLVLIGKWERNICVPSVEMFPTNLTKLKLEDSKLQEDPMPILERLQTLRILYLDGDSYVGTEMICSTGGFPNLEKLKLDSMPSLHHWDIKEGAMPILRHLQIGYCDELHVLPELQNVQTLKELTVYDPSDELREGMQMQGKDVHKIKHIPYVRISSNWLVRQFKTAKRNYKTYMLGLHDELENIIEELNRLYQRRTDLRIEDLGDLDDVDDPVACDDVDDPEIVGLEDDKEKIIEQLLDRSISRHTVLTIVGTGGLGKTTLAQKVYNSDKLEKQFDCRAWLSISQTYNLNELLREILYKVKPQMEKKNPPVRDRDLPVKLKNYFLKGNRYLIILDDVWDTDFWGQLKKALPDMYNASRVIITTRSLDVGKAADCNRKPYQLRYLSDNEGLALLFINAFQEHVQPKNYPAHLLDVAKRLTKKCGGLPLALIVLGGILTRRDRNYTAWNTLYETIDWHNKDGIQCSQVLAKSYEDLPQYLKDCFLYLAAFPEDYQISGVHLTRMWIAEGFVPKDGAGTIEDRAEECLEELVQRCLIQVTKKSWNGYCKYCSMHDLLRDLAICKAKDDSFFTVFSKEEDVNNLAASKPCRAALQFCTPTEDDIYSENTRSLLCFCFGQNSDNNSGFGLLNYSGFGLLRVLTLESINMTTFTRRQWSEGLIHLKYLRLRNCKIPHDIFKQLSFPNLETIDLNGSRLDNEETTLDLCDVVIPTLRHIYGCGYNEFHLPLKWNKHTNLQAIKEVSIHIESVVELGFCINLRTFGIFIVDELDNERAVKEWQNLKSVLKNTVQLVYLSIRIDGFLPFGGTKDLPCHEKIQKLVLQGEWERNICVPSIEMFPTNLTKLKLHRSTLQEDPMPILERLQSLRILYLCYYSYVGTELICSTGGFPNLEKLMLIMLPRLHHWDIKEGAMPILHHLEIIYCKNLLVLPELQKVRTLQELTVGWPSDELREGMQMQGKDVHKIKHIPYVRTR